MENSFRRYIWTTKITLSKKKETNCFDIVFPKKENGTSFSFGVNQSQKRFCLLPHNSWLVCKNKDTPKKEQLFRTQKKGNVMISLKKGKFVFFQEISNVRKKVTFSSFERQAKKFGLCPIHVFCFPGLRILKRKEKRLYPPPKKLTKKKSTWCSKECESV